MRSTYISVRSEAQAGFQVLSARNLDILRAIDRTLDGLASECMLIEGLRASFGEIRQRVQDMPSFRDQDCLLRKNLSLVSELCVKIYSDTAGRHKSACEDPALRSDDGVAEAYASFMESLRNLHDEVESLAEWIETNDAVQEPSLGVVYENTDDMFKALGIAA